MATTFTSSAGAVPRGGIHADEVVPIRPHASRESHNYRFRPRDPVNHRNPSPPLIRPARVADVDAMFRVRTSVRENALTTDELAGMGITPDAIATAIRGSPCAWVAEVDGEVVGFVMVDLDTACLFAAFVLPGHEGRGIGKGLIRTCEAALFERHAVAWLETARDSRAAGVYRHLGWGHEVDVGDGDVRLERQRRP